MRAGRMDRKIVIEQLSVSQNAIGEAVETWAVLAAIWAEVNDLRGKEVIEARATQAEIDTIFRIRHIAGVKHDMRISHDGGYYNIRSISKIGRSRMIEITGQRQAA